MSPTRTNMTYADAVAGGYLMDGDLLLYRGKGLIAWLIKVAGRGEYSHAAMIGWNGSRPMCLEVREFKGARAVTLESQVKRNSGRILVRGPKLQLAEARCSAAVQYMWNLTGCGYGWWGILLAGLTHLPFVRCFRRPSTDDKMHSERPPFCSQAVAAAYRSVGYDPVPHLSDRYTEPNDLWRSAMFQDKFTLTMEAAACS